MVDEFTENMFASETVYREALRHEYEEAKRWSLTKNQ